MTASSSSSSINSDFSYPNDSIHDNGLIDNAAIDNGRNGPSECRMKPVPLSGNISEVEPQPQPQSCSNVSKLPSHENNDENSTFDHPAAPMHHDFQPKTFLKPTFCDWCKKIILGVYKQGLKCKGKA